jgi:hypothetical protein
VEIEPTRTRERHVGLPDLKNIHVPTLFITMIGTLIRTWRQATDARSQPAIVED